jgi:hypothetical protein
VPDSPQGAARPDPKREPGSQDTRRGASREFPQTTWRIKNFEPEQGRGPHLGGPAADLSSELINSKRGLTHPRVLPYLAPTRWLDQAARRDPEEAPARRARGVSLTCQEGSFMGEPRCVSCSLNMGVGNRVEQDHVEPAETPASEEVPCQASAAADRSSPCLME